MKPKLASKKVPLTIKYRVGEHLDNLEARFGANKIRNMGGHLEDLTSPDDADLKPILQFRELIKRREMKPRRRKKLIRLANGISPQKYMKDNRSRIERLIMDGCTIYFIAGELGVAQGALQYFVDSHDELKTLYKATASRRKHDSTKKLGQIKNLLARGKTHQQIADELGLTKGQVDWQVEKIRRAKK